MVGSCDVCEDLRKQSFRTSVCRLSISGSLKLRLRCGSVWLWWAAGLVAGWLFGVCQVDVGVGQLK